LLRWKPYSEDLPARSETRLQLPLKLKIVGVMDEDQGLNGGKQTKESLEETRGGEHQP